MLNIIVKIKKQKSLINKKILTIKKLWAKIEFKGIILKI